MMKYFKNNCHSERSEESPAGLYLVAGDSSFRSVSPCLPDRQVRMTGILLRVVAILLLCSVPLLSLAQTYTIDQEGSESTCSGDFYDSGGSGADYDTSEFYIMTFCSDQTNCIRFTFSSFDLEDGVDFLYVYDGFSVTYPLIATLTGNSLPSFITSNTGCLTFKFVSNDTISGFGWEGSFSCVNCPSGNVCAPGDIDICSGSFYDSGGGGGNYNNNESCVRTYCTTGNNCIAVSFSSFNLEAGVDFLYVYDGPTTGSPLLVTLTGSSIPAPILSSTGCLTFWFLSNNTVTAPGWVAAFSCSQCPALPGGGSGTMSLTYNNTACGLNFVQTTHRITSRSCGLPGVGLPATYNISGMPATCVSYERAILYWSESSGNSSATVTITNPLGQVSSYFSQTIGTGIDKCWGQPASVSFRSDITQSITGNGNYTINISNGDYVVDGATLVIIYRDLNAAYQGRMVIWDGNLAYNNGIPSSLAMTYSAACASSTSAKAFVMGGDLQICGTCPTHTSTLNGSAVSFPNQFWNNDMISTSIVAGQSSSVFGITPCSNDCYVWVSMGLYYQTTACTTCPPIVNFPTTTFQDNVSCNGACDGEAVVIQSGGIPPYTYVWSPAPGSGQGTPIASNMCPGTYTITVTDASPCAAPVSVSTVVISEPGPFTSTVSQVNVSCFGNNDGEATVTVAGGTPAFTYLWSDGQTTAIATGLIAGTYTVTVTDNKGCTTANSVNITQPPAAMSIVFSAVTDVSCNGGSDGSVTAAASGGTPGYTYLWNDPFNQTTATATGLAAGIYNVTATDANGCSITDNITINEPTLLSPNASVTSNYNGRDVSCNGDCDGEATSSPSGGIPPYTYLWDDPSTQTTPVATGLCAGNYTVTVTDNNACIQIGSVTVNEPDTLVAPVAVTSNYNGEDISCNGGSDGEATVTPVGGTTAYTYLWSDGQNTSTATGLSAGTYDVTVTDVNGCDTTVSITLTEPVLLTAVTAVTSDYNGQDVSCNGASDGEAAVIAAGGILPYTYLWDANAGNQTTDTATGLSAGIYFVTVTDANGCATTVNITITEPAPLPVPIVITSDYNGEDISCFGLCDGQATATPSGGTPPYTFLWDDPNAQTDSIADSLCAGIYNILVTDVNGCNTTDSIEVIDPPLLTATTAVTSDYRGEDVSCYGFSDGEVTVYPSGGTGTYTYLWLDDTLTPLIPLQTDSIATGIDSGIYSVIVTDVNGCDTVVSVTVIEPPELIIDTIYTDTICKWECDAFATVITIGGTGAYTYLWNDPSSQTTVTASNLCEDTFNINVTDINGCTITDSIVINTWGLFDAIFSAQPDPDQIPLPITLITDTSIVSETVPLVVLFTDDSYVTYDLIIGWDWNFGDENPSPIGDPNTSTEQNPSHTYSFGGTCYEVTLIITTMNGCSDTVVYKCIVVKEDLMVPNVFTPNDDGINDKFNIFGANLEKIEGMIFNRWGQKLYIWRNPKEGWDGTTNNGLDVSEGTYYYIIKAEGTDNAVYELTGTVTLIR